MSFFIIYLCMKLSLLIETILVWILRSGQTFLTVDVCNTLWVLCIWHDVNCWVVRSPRFFQSDYQVLIINLELRIMCAHIFTNSGFVGTPCCACIRCTKLASLEHIECQCQNYSCLVQHHLSFSEEGKVLLRLRWKWEPLPPSPNLRPQKQCWYIAGNMLSFHGKFSRNFVPYIYISSFVNRPHITGHSTLWFFKLSSTIKAHWIWCLVSQQNPPLKIRDT